MFISPEDAEKLPGAIQINYEDVKNWIYFSSDSMKCFICKQAGHQAKNCTVTDSNLLPEITPEKADQAKFHQNNDIQLEKKESNPLNKVNNDNTIMSPS